MDESVLAGLGTASDFSGVFTSGGNALDLSGMMDSGSLDLNLDGLPAMDLQKLLKGIKVEVSSDGMQKLSASMLEGYQEYAQIIPIYRKISEIICVRKLQERSFRII